MTFVLRANSDRHVSSKEKFSQKKKTHSSWKNVLFYFMPVKFVPFFATVKFRFEKRKKKKRTFTHDSLPLPAKTVHLRAAFDDLDGLQAFRVIKGLCQTVFFYFFFCGKGRKTESHSLKLPRIIYIFSRRRRAVPRGCVSNPVR